MTAISQLNRIVQIIAEGSRLGDGDQMPIGDLARRFGVTPEQIQEDVRVLTLLGENAEAEWLLSLEVWQEGDQVRVASRGPWQRPLRFTAEELVALRLALATDPEGAPLLARLAELSSGERTEPGRGAGKSRVPEPPAVIDLPAAGDGILRAVRIAVQHHWRLEILYAGEGRRAARSRVIQPHQLLSYGGHWYCSAWCETAGAWRTFRVDRIVDALPAGGAFERREDFVTIEHASEVFRADADAVEPVRVRFSPAVARWVRERYPDSRVLDGGAVDVVFAVGSPAWLAREVLQYGGEAEVIEPAAYREAVRKVVAVSD